MVTGLILVAATIGLIVVVFTVLDNPIGGKPSVPQPALRTEKRRIARSRGKALREKKQPNRAKASGKLILVLVLAATSGAALIVAFLRWITGLLESVLS